MNEGFPVTGSPVLLHFTSGLAGRVGARGVPWVLTPRHHMAFQGGLEGLPDECVKCKC